jgi:hypothetical protein
VYRWRSYGVTWAQADELACRLGLHPPRGVAGVVGLWRSAAQRRRRGYRLRGGHLRLLLGPGWHLRLLRRLHGRPGPACDVP